MKIKVGNAKVDIPAYTLSVIDACEKLQADEEELTGKDLAIKEHEFLLTLLGDKQFEEAFRTTDVNEVDFNLISPAIVDIFEEYAKPVNDAKMKTLVQKLSTPDFEKLINKVEKVNGLE